jgi:hypothetical protein
VSAREINIALQCCGADVKVAFRKSEAPSMPAGKYKKNLVCPSCDQLMILTLLEEEDGHLVEQEQVSF